MVLHHRLSSQGRDRFRGLRGTRPEAEGACRQCPGLSRPRRLQCRICPELSRFVTALAASDALCTGDGAGFVTDSAASIPVPFPASASAGHEQILLPALPAILYPCRQPLPAEKIRDLQNSPPLHDRPASSLCRFRYRPASGPPWPGRGSDCRAPVGGADQS